MVPGATRGSGELLQPPGDSLGVKGPQQLVRTQRGCLGDIGLGGGCSRGLAGQTQQGGESETVSTGGRIAGGGSSSLWLPLAGMFCGGSGRWSWMVLGQPRSSREPSRVGTGKSFSAPQGTGVGGGWNALRLAGGALGPWQGQIGGTGAGGSWSHADGAVGAAAHGLCHREEVEEQSCSFTRAPRGIETPRGMPVPTGARARVVQWGWGRCWELLTTHCNDGPSLCFSCASEGEPSCQHEPGCRRWRVLPGSCPGADMRFYVMCLVFVLGLVWFFFLFLTFSFSFPPSPRPPALHASSACASL